MEHEHTDPIDKAVFAHLDAPGVVGNYVVVAEVMTEDGSYLSVAPSKGTPPWTAIGMLGMAMDVIPFTTDGHDEEEDEDYLD